MGRPRRHPIRSAIVGLLVLAVVGVVTVQFGDPLARVAARAPVIGTDCPSSRLHATTVTLTVAPELRAAITATLEPLASRTLTGRECIRTVVETQAPAGTVESAQVLPPDRAPDLWIPDSSLWVTQVPRWRLALQGSFATTPIVIATNDPVRRQLGWDAKKPTWAEALSGRQPIALPDIRDNAAQLSAVITLWQSLGQGEAAQKAVAGTVLAAGRSGAPTEAEAIKAAEAGSQDAPLVPIGEQAVSAANADGSARRELVAVRPTGGSPTLDYPVLSTGDLTDRSGEAGVRARAIRAVVSQLLSGASAAPLGRAGFEVPDNSDPATAGFQGSVQDAVATPISGLDPKELAVLVARITVLSAPSRFLTVFDLSNSMKAPAGNGQSRIAFAATAATLAGNLLTDSSQVGLWGFARDLSGKTDVLKLEDVAPLGDRQGGRSHRERLIATMQGATGRLGGNGTALFSTVLAGMEEMNARYDPRAGNAVVLFTDGANSDPGGPSLKQTLDRLRKLYDPKKPVRLVLIGIGADADMKQLTAMAGASGGQAFLARTPDQLPDVLLEVMTRRDS
jgi:Ca-activated chloride channel homolog